MDNRIQEKIIITHQEGISNAAWLPHFSGFQEKEDEVILSKKKTKPYEFNCLGPTSRFHTTIAVEIMYLAITQSR